MRLKRLFKNKILCLCVICIGLFSIYLLTLNNNDTTLPTFSPTINNSVINEDLDGNGSKDALYIKTDDKNYLIQINLNGENSLSLNPSKEFSTLGEHKTYWPMRITIADVSRNNTKELFTQCSIGENPLQSIFIFKDGSYENVFSKENNILGLIDNSNNKTPKIISGKFSSGYMDLRSYIVSNNSLKEFPYLYKKNYIGDIIVCDFINLIQSFPYDSLQIPNYFSHTLDDSSITNIYTVANNNLNYIFQDCFFKDITYDEKGLPKDVSWTLNFKGIDPNSPKKIKNFTFDIIVTRLNDSFDYKITSLDLSY